MLSTAELNGLIAPLTVAALGGYLLGALPFGYLVARSRGVNIFEVGSRSPGATNVRRVLGAGAGNTVFILDALKGAFAAGWPVVAALLFAGPHAEVLDSPSGFIGRAVQFRGLVGYVGLAFALVGHSYSCFTRFRGGKGVATAAGGIFVLMPYLAGIAAAVWLLVFYSSRFVSLASILAAMSLPVAAAFLEPSSPTLWVTGIVAAFVVIRHRSNIGRLLAGTENRFDRRKVKEDEK